MRNAAVALWAVLMAETAVGQEKVSGTFCAKHPEGPFRQKVPDTFSRPEPRLSAGGAAAIATTAPGLACLYGLPEHDAAATSIIHLVRFNPDTRLWTVTISFRGRPLYQVQVRDATGEIAAEGVVEGDQCVSPESVVDRVRRDDRVRDLLKWHGPPTFQPWYDVQSHERRGPHWRVVVWADGEGIATVLVGERLIVMPAAEAAPGSAFSLWDRIRPHFADCHWLCIYMFIFLAVFVNPRQLVSLRTLDVLVIAAQVPIGFLLKPVPLVAYLALAATTVYLFVRVMARSAAQRPLGFTTALSKRALVVLAALLLAHQALMARSADTSIPGAAGLVGGERYLDTGIVPYGKMSRGFDEYGPLHYLIHGLAARVWPSGENWHDYNPDRDHDVKNDTGARVISFAFHLLTVVALLGIGRKYAGGRCAWLLVVGYLLLATNLGYLLHASKRAPAAFMALAFWAFPNPVLSGLSLALGTASFWVPIFVFPLWLTAFRRRAAVKFALTYALVGAVFLGLALYGEGPVGKRLLTVLKATAHAEEGVLGEWGGFAEPDGLWGYLLLRGAGFGALRVGLTVVFLVFCLALAAWPRKKPPLRLAALAAAVIIGTQVWKSNQTGQYMAWYLPMLLVALFLPFTRGAGKEVDSG